MRQVLHWLPLLALCFFIAAPAQADEKKVEKLKGETIHHKPVKVDLGNPVQVDELVKELKEGKIAHLTEDKPVNPLELAWDLGLWTIVVFVLLFLILRKIAWGPMLEGLKKREETIKAAVDEAKLARAETQRITAEFKAKMDEAYAEIPKMMDEARRDAAAMAEEMRTRAQAEIQAERQRLRRELDLGRDQALKELQEHAANLATLISAKVLKRSISPDDHRRLVDEALVEVVEVAKERRVLTELGRRTPSP